MIPIKLVISAFGSYAEREEIDFTRAGAGVFLVTGDTGAGKTTIFDAITYALYDQTSGGRREGNMMRSQYADAETPTFVEFSFRYRGEEYRVVRSPEYERKSRRKGKDGEIKYTTERANAALYMPDGQEFLGKKAEINRKIVEIIGLDAEQFTQTVMIAQGEFLKLLYARSDERKEIFSRLFCTEVCARIQRKLKDRTKELYGMLQDVKKAQEQEQSHLVWMGIGERELFFETPLPEQRLERIDRLLEEGRQREEALKEQAERLQKELEKKKEILARTEDRNQQFERCREARMKKAGLESKKEYFLLEKKKVELAGKAERVRGIWDQYRQAEDQKKLLEHGREDMEQELRDREKSGEECRKLRREQEERLKKRQEAYKKAEQEAGELEKWLGQHKECRVFLEKARKAEEEENKRWEELCTFRDRLPAVAEGRTEQAGALRRLEEKKRDYEKARLEHEQKNECFLREQAGMLAAGLGEGKPCPVCGSLEHPAPAELSGEAPTQEEVKEARRLRERKEAEKDEAQQRFLDVRKECAAEERVLLSLGRKLIGEDFSLDEEEAPAKVDEAVRAAQRRLEDCREQTAQKTLEVEQYKAAETRQEAFRKSREESLASMDRIREEILTVEERLQLSVQRSAVLRGEIAARAEALQKMQTVIDERRRDYEAALEKEGFLSEERYRDSLMDEEKKQQILKECQAYEEACIQADTQVKMWERELEGLTAADTREMREGIQDLEKEKTAAEEARRELYSRNTVNRTVKEKLERLYRDEAELEERYTRYLTLDQTANGNLAGSAKIDFESYVQRRYFRQIISCANQRLYKMASGDFLLTCRALENLGMRGNVGLDLDVYSLDTGKIRDVRTLSGGESFMAALSMALGLADVISRTAGGVQMKTMFVDEGFGSLDEYSREQAIGVLNNLAGGERMIGIISHVTELKESIDRQLVVSKTKKGSHVQWNL